MPILATHSVLVLATLAPPAQDPAPELLADLRTELVEQADVASLRLRGSALGKLWMSGERPGQPQRLWTLDGPGAEPQPFDVLDELGLPYSVTTLDGVTDLGNGRALVNLWLFVLGPSILLTDGTSAGSEVVDLNLLDTFAGSEALFPNPALVNGKAYFRATSPDGPPGLYETDGTAAGTHLVFEAASTSATGRPMRFGDKILIQEVQFPTSRLWCLDPAQGQATLLAEGAGNQSPLRPLSLGSIAVFNWRPGMFLTSATGTELWRTDGTPEGTQPIADLLPGPDSSFPNVVAADDERVLFTAETEDFGRELWRTDGTAAGTQLVLDLRPGPLDGIAAIGLDDSILEGAELDGDWFFAGDSNGFGPQVWKSDGTLQGTLLLPTAASISNPSRFTRLAGRIALTARDTGTEDLPFITESGGLIAMSDVEPLGSPDLPGNYAELGGHLFFTDRNQAKGTVLFSSPFAAPELIEETPINTEFPTADLSTDRLVSIGDRAFFASVWVNEAGIQGAVGTTDGTPEGTSEFSSAPGFPSLAGSLDQDCMFYRQSPIDGFEPWITDGTPEGTRSLGTYALGQAGTPTFPFEPGQQFGDRFYFIGRVPGAGSELLRTTADRTAIEVAVDILPGPGSGLDKFTELLPFENRLFFACRPQSPINQDLWSTDGTPAGTAPFAPHLFQDSTLLDFERQADRIELLVRRPQSGQLIEHWTTDGTREGTLQRSTRRGRTAEWFHTTPERFAQIENAQENWVELVRFTDSAPPETVLGPMPLDELEVSHSAPHGLFVTLGLNSGLEPGLWFLEAATLDLRRIAATPLRIEPVGNSTVACFSLPDAELGLEPWLTDGTPEGTRLLADVYPGPPSSTPWPLGRANSAYVFSAHSPSVGRELHAIPWSAIGSGDVQPFGSGCSPTAVPELRLPTLPAPGTTLAFELGNLPALSPAFLLRSTESTSTPLGPCPLYLAHPSLVVTAPTDPAGSLQLTVDVPDTPTLAGLRLFVQAGALSPLQPTFETTNALDLQLGS